MTPIQPRVTIQNIEGSHWLVTIEHVFSADQSLVFTTQVPKHLRDVTAITQSCFAQLQALLEAKGLAAAKR